MFSFLLSVLISLGAEAKIVWQAVEYKQGDTALQGYIAFDDKSATKRPGIVLVHDWMGMSPFVKGRAVELAAGAPLNKKSKVAMAEFFAETLKNKGGRNV